MVSDPLNPLLSAIASTRASAVLYNCNSSVLLCAFAAINIKCTAFHPVLTTYAIKELYILHIATWMVSDPEL